MKKLFFLILFLPSFVICQSVEELYGDRIELLGIPFKDPFVLCQVLIAIFLVTIFLQSSLDKIFDRKNNMAFFESYFSNTLFRYITPYLLTIITIFELAGSATLIYGVYYTFTAKTTLWIFYGYVILALTIMFLLLGQRIAKDYEGSANLVPYFILIMLGIMSMY
tara:strand:- start:1312 stop:1806 length:495 start_codon:yes stop_codon:yes gene_type:complete